MQSKLLVVLLLFPVAFSLGQNNYFESVQKDRDNFEQKLLQTDSILNKDEQKAIQKLNYFPTDSSWVLTAKFKKDKGKTFEMPTTTSRKPKYKRVGYLHFERNNDHFKLAVYKNLGLKDKKYLNYVFVPFKDANAPGYTYGGGRYLDLEISLKDKTVLVDFNKAYNPYCVYSYRYSCPITPEENHVDIKINAGVMNPNKDQ